MATRLPYYTGEGDIYSQLMRQFQQEVPYYSSPATFGGGYDPTLYSRQPNLNYVPGLLGDTGFSTGGDSSGLLGSPTGSTSGFGGFGGSGVAADGTVSTGFGGLSLSPSGVVSANTVSVPAAMGLGLITGLPLGLIATISNQSANQAAQGLTSSMADTMGTNAGSGVAATAGPGGTGGAAAAASAAAAAAAAAAGMSDAAQGAAGQAAANAAISGASPSEAAAAGASAAAAATTGETGIAGLATGFSDGGTAGGDASGIAGIATGFSDSGTVGGNADAGPSGGGGGGKIICTKLHELGKMPTEIYEADQAFGAMLVSESPETYNGYACWARHVVRWMGRDDLFGKFVVFAAYHIATPWSKAMAQEMGVDVKAGWFGRQLMKQGLKVCRAIGQMNQDRSVQNV